MLSQLASLHANRRRSLVDSDSLDQAIVGDWPERLVKWGWLVACFVGAIGVSNGE